MDQTSRYIVKRFAQCSHGWLQLDPGKHPPRISMVFISLDETQKPSKSVRHQFYLNLSMDIDFCLADSIPRSTVEDAYDTYLAKLKANRDSWASGRESFLDTLAHSEMSRLEQIFHILQRKTVMHLPVRWPVLNGDHFALDDNEEVLFVWVYTAFGHYLVIYSLSLLPSYNRSIDLGILNLNEDATEMNRFTILYYVVNGAFDQTRKIRCLQ